MTLVPLTFWHSLHRMGIVICLGLGAVAAAQPAPTEITRVGATRLALERNLGHQIERLEVRRQAAGLTAAWQPYLPTLSLDGDWSKNPSSLHQPLVGYSAGLGVRTLIGTEVTAFAQGSQPLGSGATLPTGAALGLSLTQPLLKDAWGAARLPLKEAEATLAIEEQLFRQELQTLLLGVEVAYWDLAVAAADVAIKGKSLQRALAQFEDTQENIRRGILAASDIYVVEENTVFFRQEVLRAEESSRAASRRLSELLQLPLETPLRPTDVLAPVSSAVPPGEEMMAVMMARHPSLLAQRGRVELASTRASVVWQNTLPTVDLKASFGVTGTDVATGSAWRQLTSTPTPEARVGLHFELPLGQPAVRAVSEKARLEREREELALRSLESTLKLGLEEARFRLATELDLFSLVQQQVHLAELKLSAETEKYKTGISRLPEVVRFQRDLDTAQLALQRSLRALQVASAQLLFRQGTLAQARGLEAQP